MSAFFPFMQKYCFNYGWGKLELQVRKVAHQNFITHSLTLRSLKLLHCSNLHTDSPGFEDCEQWSPLAKFFWKPDSLTLCGCSYGHICRTGGEWNWMQSFPRSQPCCLKCHWVLEVVGGRWERHPYNTLVTGADTCQYSSFIVIICQTLELLTPENYFLEWDSRKETKHQCILIPTLMYVTQTLWGGPHASSCWHLALLCSQ